MSVLLQASFILILRRVSNLRARRRGFFELRFLITARQNGALGFVRIPQAATSGKALLSLKRETRLLRYCYDLSAIDIVTENGGSSMIAPS